MFKVDPAADAAVQRQPIKAMGRFTHEAAAVDPDTSVVFLTEDYNPDGFYRFIPDVQGQLGKGGVLQALKVKGMPEYDTLHGQTVGAALPRCGSTSTTPTPMTPRNIPAPSGSKEYGRALRSS